MKSLVIWDIVLTKEGGGSIHPQQLEEINVGTHA